MSGGTHPLFAGDHMDTVIKIINRCNSVAGELTAPLTLVVTFLVLLEVVTRYFFNAPTSWSNEANQYLLCALVMLGAGYTLRDSHHVRVDIIYASFSERKKALVELTTSVILVVSLIPMIWFGVIVTYEAILSGETSVSAARLPLWPSKATVPIGASLLLLQGIANGLKAIQKLFPPKGREPATRISS